MNPIISMNFIDYLILAAYLVITLVVGYALKKYMKTSEDFFLSGRSLPSWITSLAFLSANLGALEVIGMVANSAKYGILTVHFYWIGAIPAMIFLGLFMMPFYYNTKVRSVPEYLKLRYNEATRGVNAFSFAIMTLLMSGISMYAMALIFRMMLGWSLTSSILLSALVVLIYVFFGGLSSSIYNEVIQFFLIWLGLLPAVYVGLKAVGGFSGLAARLPETFLHAWKNMGSAAANPMGVDWMGVVLGLGFVLSFGYWTTDFLVVQRTLASENISAARRTPIMAAFPKMLVPLIVVVPGLLAVAILPEYSLALQGSATPDYNSALILLLAHYLPSGVLGLAITGLLASFMSGMAGNVTAFNTVWTYDIYGTYIKKNMPDKHYLMMGKLATIFGVLFSIGTAYIVQSFPNLMDYMQLIFSFFNAPLFATFLLGMFWKKATPWGGFFGLLSGILMAAGHYLLYKLNVIHYSSEMAANFFQAWWAWLTDFGVTILVSLFTKKKSESELRGLVYSLTPRTRGSEMFWRRPEIWGSIALIVMVILNIIFW
ncbi:MAG: sodium:solute symporter family protein [Candidatus Aminicenantales bacterium]|jgi:SSS family solute:Na+ symporter|nr:sodium:solute symporter family protein [Candidatus Saccharicenans sp.]NMC65743.1 sodium:solute symporter family protein [Acidobacteriota bacterium]